MSTAIVLGAGLVGSVMAADLARDADLDVTIADRDPNALARARARCADAVTTVEVDLGDPEAVRRLVAHYDVVLGALPSTIGFAALRAVVEAGSRYSDISFMPENALTLDGLARERGAIAVVDCGVAPGMSNMLAGAAAAMLDPCERIDIAVGGVPRDPRPPFRYKAAFSPHDVIEEYTRPARLVEDGRVVVREALSGVEPIGFAQAPRLDALEAFNTDGLRSLIETLDVPAMSEKTIRYRGHADLMRVFRETGLFGRDPIDAGGTRVRPLDVTSALLFPKWTYEPGEADLTLMRVAATGRRGGVETRLCWEMIDEHDAATDTSSMARTTAFPCAAVARLLLAGRIGEPGVIPPERLGADAAILAKVLGELARRRVRITGPEEQS